MNRQEKEVVVSELTQHFNDYKNKVIVNYKGLTVDALQSLRRDLRKDGGVFKVTKARLMRRAAQDHGQGQEWVNQIEGEFKGQVGLVFSSSDVSLLAKKLVDFAKTNEKLQIVSALVEAKVFTVQDLKVIASLPPREQLLAMLVGMMQAPITGYVRVLNALLVKLVVVLQEIAKQKEQQV